MDKIKVEICCGTACYLLGAANLMSIEDEIPAEFRDKVEVEARTCEPHVDRGGDPRRVPR